MTDPWVDVRELVRQARPTPDSIAEPLLADADALLAARRETEAQITHLRHWMKSDLSALDRDQLLAAIDRSAHDALALAALPEHLTSAP